MKKFLFLSFIFLVLPLGGSAQENRESAPQADNFRLAGEVEVDQVVEGDLISLGSIVVINEEVRGSAIVGAGDIIINAPIKGNLRALGGRIIISSHISGNVALVGGDIIFQEASIVDGNLAAAGGKITLAGAIGGNLKSYSGEVKINGDLKGNADIRVAESKNIILGERSSVGGDFYYQAPDANLAFSKEQIKGEVVFAPTLTPGKLNGFWLFLRLVALFGMLVVGLVMVSIWPKSIKRTVSESMKQPSRDWLWGVGVLILTPIVIVLLALTIIGFPLALVLLVIYLVSLYLAKIFTGIILGTYILGAIRGKDKISNVSLLWLMIIGVLALWLVSSLPAVGQVISALAIIWGLGLIVKLKRHSVAKLEG